MLGKCKAMILVAGASALAFVLTESAWAAPVPAPAPAPAAMFGAPAVCFPFEIGKGPSLPWTDGTGSRWSGKVADYDVTRCVDDTLAALDQSDDALVHMETLRRFAIYVSGLGGDAPKTKAWRQLETQRLLSNLEQRAGDGVVQDSGAVRKGVGHVGEAELLGGARVLGLRWFDLAYLKVVLHQAGLFSTNPDPAAFETALQLRPGDAAMHFGAAIAAFSSRGKDKRMWLHLDKALTLTQDRDSLLSRNIVRVMGSFVGGATREKLEASVAKALEDA